MLLAQTPLQHLIVVCERPGSAQIFTGQVEKRHVGRVVFPDGRGAVEQDDPVRGVREQPHRVEAHLYLGLDLDAVPSLPPHEAPHLHLREPEAKLRLFGVEVPEHDLLVAPEEAWDLLILGGHVEEAPVDVPRQPWIVAIDPGLVVRAPLRLALWPGDVDGSDPHVVGCLSGRREESPRVLDIGQGRAVLRRIALPEGVGLPALSAESVRPGDAFDEEGLGLGRDRVLPHPVSDDGHFLHELAVELERRPDDRAWLAARRVGVRAHQDLAATLGHGLVEHRIGEFLAHQHPERRLGHGEPGLREGEQREPRHPELVAIIMVEGPGQEAELIGLHDSHEITSCGARPSFARLAPRSSRPS